MTLEILAGRVGVHPGQLMRWEHGTAEPFVRWLPALARELDCSILEFFE